MVKVNNNAFTIDINLNFIGNKHRRKSMEDGADENLFLVANNFDSVKLAMLYTPF